MKYVRNFQHTFQLIRRESVWVVPNRPRVPLIPTVVLLVLLQIAGMSAWRQARSVNERWLEIRTDKNHQSKQVAPVDQFLSKFWHLSYTHPCEIGRPKSEVGTLDPCEGFEKATSPALAAVDLKALPPPSRELLEEHGYESADHLLQELLLTGQGAYVPQTLLELVQTGELSSFAVHDFLLEWYLTPAVDYYRSGRAEDASDLFIQFVDAELAAFKGGTRLLTASGVDISDLPVLFEAFCRESPDESSDLKQCAIPFLSALAAPTRFWLPIIDGIPRFQHHYETSPGRSHDLVAYLKVENRIGKRDGVVKGWDPETLPPQARYLGHYVKGRHLVFTARAQQGDCPRLVQAALSEFQRAFELDSSGLFQRAIVESVEEMRERAPCQKRNSNK